jgi:hypothetical protein
LNTGVALIVGAILIAIGGVLYFLVQQPFTDCPSFMGLAVGAIPQDVLDRCQISGALQIMGSALFVVGVGLGIYGIVKVFFITDFCDS